MTRQPVEVGDPGAMLDAIGARRPILVRGLTDDWKASGWTFDSLRALAGNRTVKVLLDLPDRGGMLEGGQHAYESELPFAAFLDRAEQPGTAPCYLGYLRPEELIPGCADAFDFGPMTVPSRHPTDTRLWIGSAGTCSGLHSDLKDNVFAQISGRKRLILVPLRETHLVYPFVDNIANSMVDPDHVDTARFRRGARAWRRHLHPAWLVALPAIRVTVDLDQPLVRAPGPVRGIPGRAGPAGSALPWPRRGGPRAVLAARPHLPQGLLLHATIHG